MASAPTIRAGVAKLVYAPDSKSGEVTLMRVRVSPPAPTSNANQMEKLNPPLKWAGGKRWLVPHLEPLWRKYAEQRYIEPFCGGLAVALGLQPERALLNDLNRHLINFYQQLGRGLSLKIEARYNERLFYAHRERVNQLIKEDKATN